MASRSETHQKIELPKPLVDQLRGIASDLDDAASLTQIVIKCLESSVLIVNQDSGARAVPTFFRIVTAARRARSTPEYFLPDRPTAPVLNDHSARPTARQNAMAAAEMAAAKLKK